jgi:hypothetical protein
VSGDEWVELDHQRIQELLMSGDVDVSGACISVEDDGEKT